MALKEKLKQDLESRDKSQVDWDKRKQEWISSVNELNSQIKTWFSDYEAEGLVKFKLTQKQKTEEYIGQYKVNVLHMLFANDKEIIIEPMGTLIIGAWGRLDVYFRGYNSEKQYILRSREDNGNFSWQIVNAQNKREIRPLTKEALEELIEKWFS